MNKPVIKYTTSQSLDQIIYVFKEYSSAHQARFYLIQNIAKAVILWNRPSFIYIIFI